MKHSIKKIFLNLNTYLFFILFTSFVTLALIFEHQLEYEKINNLKQQQNIILELTKLKQSDISIALIQFNGKSTQLLQEIDKLRTLYKYNYTDRYIFNNEAAYLADLKKLSILTKEFNENANILYSQKLKEDSEEQDKLATQNLKKSFYTIRTHIDSILLKSLTSNQDKFSILLKIATAVFILIFFPTLVFRRHLNLIYKDINYLYQIEKNKIKHAMFTIEGDALSQRISRKSTLSDNPTMLDPVTNINNYKGMINSYSEKKGLKDSNFISLTILEIDNFSKSKRTFSQEFTQVILKKIAYTISLYELPVDTIARTDYNQFTVILSRTTKELAYKDIEIIRESIAELKFNSPEKGNILVTVTGGFVIKPNNTNIEEATRKATEILEYAKSTGTNKIYQLRDLAQKGL
ncbi:diguanylate cyclase [Sulfurimonas sp.]|jgi:diguanylate cyclase (GGDEF)-like protein|uniref:diguanylate cyclase domain-containing protein n=1 Tax=Sulfurimonas sp. TaxID=2022749 RepID=UPI0025CF4734|nr:diguanylate cyclase [Sulfurimonas sp.]MBT5934224.1 diguanylate cyclase [Sulfurimonas sp.]